MYLPSFFSQITSHNTIFMWLTIQEMLTEYCLAMNKCSATHPEYKFLLQAQETLMDIIHITTKNHSIFLKNTSKSISQPIYLSIISSFSVSCVIFINICVAKKSSILLVLLECIL